MMPRIKLPVVLLSAAWAVFWVFATGDGSIIGIFIAAFLAGTVAYEMGWSDGHLWEAAEARRRRDEATEN